MDAMDDPKQLCYWFKSRLNWIYPLVLGAAVIGVSIWYLYPQSVEFPMDDTYIHFTYAQNLVKYGQLFFNYPGEIGVGTTSFLWVLILAVGYALGIPVHLAAKILGISSLILLGTGLFMLLKSKLPQFWAFICALAIVLSGNLLWFALSGMETILFLALGVLSLILYRGQPWGWLGFTSSRTLYWAMAFSSNF